MKKIILTLLVSFSIISTSFAQNNIEGMRALTITTLMQYGQKLYDRGNFSEASAVFNRVLSYDSHQKQALDYLKKLEHSSIVPVGTSIKEENTNIPMVKEVDIASTESLKEAIKEQKQVIEKLKFQIEQLRADIASQSAT